MAKALLLTMSDGAFKYRVLSAELCVAQSQPPSLRYIFISLSKVKLISPESWFVNRHTFKSTPKHRNSLQWALYILSWFLGVGVAKPNHIVKWYPHEKLSRTPNLGGAWHEQNPGSERINFNYHCVCVTGWTFDLDRQVIYSETIFFSLDGKAL